MYIADWLDYRVRKVTPDGVISTFAGTGSFGSEGDGGLATSAQLSTPQGVAVDSKGNVYIADRNNHRVRKVNSTGHISTFAGTGVDGFNGDNGLAKNAQLKGPWDVAVDSVGNVYIAEWSGHRVRKVTPDGVISTFAGTGVNGFNGDTNPAESAQLNHPIGLAVDGDGNVYIADRGNHRVRVVEVEPAIPGFVGGDCIGSDNTCEADLICNTVDNTCRASVGDACSAVNHCIVGAACQLGVCKAGVGGSCAGGLSSQCVGGSVCQGSPAVCKVNVGGSCSGNQCVANGICDVDVCKVVVGGSCAGGLSSQCVGGSVCQGSPAVCKVNVGGSCAGDRANHCVGGSVCDSNFCKVAVGGSCAGDLSSQCVSGASCGLGANSVCVLDGSVVVGGQCNSDVQCVANGICDVNVCKVRVGASCSVNQCVSGASCGLGANSVCVLDGSVVVGGQCNSDVQCVSGATCEGDVCKAGVGGSCAVTDDCVSGASCGVADTTGARSCIRDGSLSMDAACDDSRQCGSGLSCARTTNMCKKSVGAPCTESTECATDACDTVNEVCARKIITLAGTGTAGFNGDDKVATSAHLSSPRNVAVDGAGNVYTIDNGNHRVRVVNKDTGYISTLAGDGTRCSVATASCGNGGLAVDAQLNTPAVVVVDGVDNVYVAERYGHRVRKVTPRTPETPETPGGVISTFVGSLSSPADVAVDGEGRVYIAELGTSSVRVLNSDGSFNRMISGWSGPHGLAVFDQDVYVAEWSGHRVRKVTPGGGIFIVAGTGMAGFNGDGPSAESAQLRNPGGVAVDSVGNVYIADYGNHRVRVVNKDTGYISTLAGTGVAGSMGDGGSAKSAQLRNPLGVAVDSVGNVYIADFGNHRIRVVLVE